MDRHEKLWAVVTSAREAIGTMSKDDFSAVHGRAFFGALVEFFGDQQAIQSEPSCWEDAGKIDTRTIDGLRQHPDQRVVIRLAADFISIDKAPLRLEIIPELDQFSARLRPAILSLRE